MLDWINGIDPSTLSFSDWLAVVPVAIAGLIVWSLWLYRCILSALARPIVNDFRDDHLRRRSLVPRGPGHPDDVPGHLARPGRPRRSSSSSTSRTPWPSTGSGLSTTRPSSPCSSSTPASARRWASASGWPPSELLVLDRLGHPVGAGAARQRPDARSLDPDVGAVSTQQNVYQRDQQRLAAHRRLDGQPALLRLRAGDGHARARSPAVSGRTAAYRRSVVLPVLENLENEFFLGRRCIAGDDGRLTWLVLASGYKTVHQSSARAMSMFPATFRAFVKQRVRWSRNSYRCYLTAVCEGLAVADAVRHQGHGAADPADAGDDGHHPRLPLLQPAGADPERGAAGRAPGSCSAGASGASRTCAGTRRRSCCSPLFTLVVILVALPDQALRLRHDEQAGLADPLGRDRRW